MCCPLLPHLRIYLQASFKKSQRGSKEQPAFLAVRHWTTLLSREMYLFWAPTLRPFFGESRLLSDLFVPSN